MVIGDRVRLRRDLAEHYSLDRFGHRKKADWAKRTGSVLALSKPSNANPDVTVKWDDRNALDHWPPRALEVIRHG